MANVVEQSHHFNDGVVIERRVVVIAALQRPHLRPAAIGELRREQVANAALHGGACVWFCVRPVHEKAQLGRCRSVVDGGDVLPTLVLGEETLPWLTRPFGEVDVFGPSAGGRLKRQHGLEHASRAVVVDGCPSCWRIPKRRGGEGRPRHRRRTRCRGPTRGEFGGEQGAIECLRRARPIYVGVPRRPLIRAQGLPSFRRQQGRRVALHPRTGQRGRCIGLRLRDVWQDDGHH